ncbi:DUF262 domain-containing protein [Chryseobacterium sp. Ch-15]|uniref:DUF262 domain-containing protein n=1 Tax=Chryseobacterium muglaense TaxID=2893752 RepID=A0A9Q3US61_9FLAO|nr:DUF262 domain-containing protein [Chryseobacterium muglaense]MBD3907315.1 DUF262 domain-containing protein [Chryseobacterium muglaense]MCC9033033.1 DUF262 domain-containing protein [Chryseobacterium muglaense]MCM2556936.1 DUF262 domain-containing protein [Chryseobacterium muglaense]
MKKTLYTFWHLINECTIQIPTIQRDYTYGREGAKEISTKLINSILQSLQGEGNSLHLDFVYGKKVGIENFTALERNKSSIDTLLLSLKNYAENLNIAVDFNTQQKQSSAAEVITFIPLDGQQRLTTLFLIYWYIANFLKDKESKRILQRFKYATRSSSKEFLQFLTHYENCFDYDCNSLIDNIQNHEEFFSKWTKDPTVLSMLFVLNEINKQFDEKNIEPKDAWKKLTKQEIITFDFFDLDDFELTDELYLKMNARGKKLTHFENYKAWLQKNYTDKIQITDWKKKFDLGWNDLFWNEKALGDSKIDTAYLQFFKNMFLGDYLMNEDISEKDENIDLLRLNADFNPVSLFEKNKNFRDNITDYFEVLEYFSMTNLNAKINPLYNEIENINKFLFSKNVGLTWWHTTLYFAITRYIIENKNNLTYLNQWIRVISNLIYNTPIESPKLFKEAAQSILELLEKVGDLNVYEVIEKLNNTDIGFFNEKQKEEEIIKAQKIVNEPQNSWESTLIDLEKHNYFYGQVGFIFKLNESEEFTIFKENSLKAKQLFSEKIMKNPDYILFRSLLTYGNCFFKSGNTLTYPSNVRGTLRNRNENWRRFIDSKFNYVKNVIDETNLDEDIEQQLNNLIQNYDSTLTNRVKLIMNSELLKYPENNHIRVYDKGFYLLSKTRIYGFFKEVFTYDWYILNRIYCSNNSIEYVNGKGEDSNPGLFIKKINKKIIIDAKSLKYKFEEEDNLFDTVDEILKQNAYAMTN